MDSIQPTTSCDHDYFSSYFDSRAFWVLDQQGLGYALVLTMDFCGGSVTAGSDSGSRMAFSSSYLNARSRFTTSQQCA